MDEVDGQFQVIQRKVAVPLVPSSQCNSDLKFALNNQRQGLGNRFQLDSSEICAGGEIGKDACTGDGGSPLVCRAQSGRWTVVGQSGLCLGDSRSLRQDLSLQELDQRQLIIVETYCDISLFYYNISYIYNVIKRIKPQ